MSSLIVEVCEIDKISPHPNADRLEICKVKGWNVITGKGQFSEWDKCVYIPPDSVLPLELAERLGVTKYLGAVSQDADSPALGGRVRVAKLRGERSYGMVLACENPDWEVGTDVASHYGITKWEPPIKAISGDEDAPHEFFHTYFDMENIRNFPDLFEPGEEVVVTEKIHGENARLGLIQDTNEKGELVWKWMAGSHNSRKKRYWQKYHQERDEQGNPIGDPVPVGNPQESVFWMCFDDKIRSLMCDLSNCGYYPEEIDNEPPVKDYNDQYNVVIFGERYGSSIQDMAYGFKNGRFSFRAFDITLNGKYMDYNDKMSYFNLYGVETVPVLWRGPFDFKKIEELSEGPTTLCKPEEAGSFKEREGIVVISIKERFVSLPTRTFDRAQLKCINFAYLDRKGGTEYH